MIKVKNQKVAYSQQSYKKQHYFNRQMLNFGEVGALALIQSGYQSLTFIIMYPLV